MAIVGSWGSKSFEISEERLHSFEEFAAEMKLASDEQRDDAQKPSTNVKGTDLETVSFSIKVGMDYGTIARQEKNDWYDLLNEGGAHPLVLNGTPWNAADLQLQSVSVSEAKWGPNGEMIEARLALSFKEWQEQAAVQKKTSGNKKGGASKSNKSATASKNSNAAAAKSQGSVPLSPSSYSTKNASLAKTLPKGAMSSGGGGGR